MVSFDCLNPVETTLIDPDRWWTTLVRSFQSGFFMSGMQWKLPENWPFAGIQALAVLQMVVTAGWIIRSGPHFYARWITRPIWKTTTIDAKFLLFEFGSILQHLWQFWLGVLFFSTPSTGMSGLSMGAVFFHAMAETSLFVLRLMTLNHTSVYKLGRWAFLLVLLTTIQVLLDSPVGKAIVTGLPAGVSDLGNVVVTLLLLRRSWFERQEISPVLDPVSDPPRPVSRWHGADGRVVRGGHIAHSEVEPGDEDLRSTPDNYGFYASQAFFAIFHIFVFYPHLFVVCQWPSVDTERLLTLSALLNLMLYVKWGDVAACIITYEFCPPPIHTSTTEKCD